jgi:hypothetical protein
MPLMKTKKAKMRGAFNRAECVFLGAWFPRPLVEALDTLVKREDSDRSKILRRAVFEKLREVA